MPFIKKLIRLKESFAVILPKAWLEYFTRQYGSQPTEVAILEDGDELRIRLLPPPSSHSVGEEPGE